ncbi:MAG TPA: ABC transporter permease [Gemmatimonadaceae bacterium]|nr:ABC transporter permease [Gemmatimonadaceae bacterium]
MAAWLVPEFARNDWVDEWLGELAAHQQALSRDAIPAPLARIDLVLRALGALSDALWLRRHHGGSHVLRDDLRLALRSLVRRPAFSAVVIATLAMSMGATAAVFTVVSAVLLRDLPYSDADRLVMVWSNDTQRQEPRAVVSVGDYRDWRERAASFSALATYFPEWNLTLTGEGPPERLQVGVVSANLFPALGVDAALGRTFTSDEEQPGGPRAAVLSHGYWASRFGGDSAIVGTAITLDGEPYVVVGVLPPDARLPDASPQIYAPLPVLGSFIARRQVRLMHVVGRLAPGVTVQAASAELSSVARALATELPQTNAGFGTTVVPLREQVAGDARRPLLLLFGSALFVLLIGCANVANLMLVRGSARAREFALRTALGAGRGRLVRQLLTESGVIAILAGVIGVAIAFAAVPLLLAMAPVALPRLNDIRVDGAALAFTTLLVLSTAVAFGLLPALRASRVRPAMAMAEGGRPGSAGRTRKRLRDGLVVAEVAIATVLLVGAGLLLASFTSLVRADPGFRPDQVLAMTISLSRSEFPDPLRRMAVFREMEERMSELPGVSGVGAVTRLPLDADPLTTRVYAEGQTVVPDASLPEAQLRTASAGYFRAMSIPIVRGRSFDSSDDAESAATLAAVVTRAFARDILHDENPIGHRFKLGGSADDEPWFTVIGVAGDLRDGAYRDAPQPQVFRHALQAPSTTMTMVVRSASPPELIVAAMRRTAGELTKSAPVYDVRTLEAVVSRAQTSERFLTTLIGIFAALGLILAAMGIYGVLANAVTERTQEIGIRMALGARGAVVLREVVGRGMVLTVAGLLAGVVLSLGTGKALSGALYEVQAGEPRVLLGAIILLATAAAVAAWLPARRASRVDPLVALRAD